MLKFDQYIDVEKAMWFMESRNISLIDNVYRPLSESYFEFFREARHHYKNNNLKVSELDALILDTDLGVMMEYEGKEVPLDCPLVEETEPELNEPKRGGPKKFYVFVKDPSTGNVKKVTWGDTTGLKVKINNVAARKSFAARHKCDIRNDKTKPSYWACRLPRYAKMLGMQVDNPGSWW
tara:strand:+ start:434 stop:970 length:537 start_codon:yes stop_codon:yes gene_type:complete